jgi:drug/metabolite transporter (DMT)-like permease
MNNRKPLDLTACLSIVLLCSLWGGQQVLFKLTIHDIHPNMQIALRSAIGCILLAAFMWHKGVSLALWRGPWRAGTMVGSLFALEWWMIGEALQYTSASHVVVFLYTAPIFTALGLHIWRPDERLNWWQWIGVLICFSGIGLAFLGSSSATQLDPQTLLGDCLALGGGVLWAATTVVTRCSGLARIPATQTTMYQLLIGALVILLLCLVLGETKIHWSPFLVASVVGQGLVISFFSLLVWIWLLRHYLASRVSIFTFIAPLIGVGLSVWLLDEPLHSEFVWGAVMVMAGMILVNLAPQTRRLNGA